MSSRSFGRQFYVVLSDIVKSYKQTSSASQHRHGTLNKLGDWNRRESSLSKRIVLIHAKTEARNCNSSASEIA